MFLQKEKKKVLQAEQQKCGELLGWRRAVHTAASPLITSSLKSSPSFKGGFCLVFALVLISRTQCSLGTCPSCCNSKTCCRFCPCHLGKAQLLLLVPAAMGLLISIHHPLKGKKTEQNPTAAFFFPRKESPFICCVRARLCKCFLKMGDLKCTALHCRGKLVTQHTNYF